MRQNPHVRICGGPGSATTLVYPTQVGLAGSCCRCRGAILRRVVLPDRHDRPLATRVLMDGGMAKAVAVRLVAVDAVACGIPSAVSLAVFENQDWVWRLWLMISGLFVAVAVI